MSCQPRDSPGSGVVLPDYPCDVSVRPNFSGGAYVMWNPVRWAAIPLSSQPLCYLHVYTSTPAQVSVYVWVCVYSDMSSHMACDGHIKPRLYSNKMLVSNNKMTIGLEQPLYCTPYNILLCATVVRWNSQRLYVYYDVAPLFPSNRQGSVPWQPTLQLYSAVLNSWDMYWYFLTTDCSMAHPPVLTYSILVSAYRLHWYVTIPLLHSSFYFKFEMYLLANITPVFKHGSIEFSTDRILYSKAHCRCNQQFLDWE